ncbi:MAG: HD-GYP domain-containing protein [Clostridiales bacterium]|jgi:HD-GYP domain-containing protein (c-di-GMP phosphodiesterase class II)|nr:HD-GYP domain-containing protein [Clostridiales bacterium]
MRFVPSNCLKPGQKLGRDLVFDRNRILLRYGVSLTEGHIGKIQALGFQGVYIDDDISKDVYAESIISDELRHRAQKDVRSLFVKAEADPSNRSLSHVLSLTPLINNIVDEVLHNRNLMMNVIDIRAYDDYTYSHSINVTVLSTMLGLVLGLNRTALNELAMGAVVHDLGKIFVDKRIINKASKLTLDEFEEVKRHSLAGFNYLNISSALPGSAKVAVLSHHEQYNGNGYPGGHAGDDIHLYGRVIAVADVYDALVSDRPYRHAMLPSDAVEYVMSGYNTMFDPLVVDAFVRKVAPYPVGTCVRLSNNVTGIVVENFESACLRPKIKVVKNGEATDEYLDLAHDHGALSVTILGMADI